VENKIGKVDNDVFCYMFGYGSLMYPSGMSGRGLSHKYTWENLSTATLFGYKRGMFANYHGLLYYGMMESPDAIVEGVLVPIFSKADFEALLINEGAHDKYENTPSGKMYDIKDVTKLVCGYNYTLPNTVPVYALVNKVDKSEGGRITPWYVANVWGGILPWGYPFIDRLQHTGIIKPSNLYMKIGCLYNATKFIRKIRRR